MDKRKVDQFQAEELRRKAETRLKLEEPLPAEISPAEVQKLIHELRVHQIELEMQNDELRQAQEILEESRSRYSDLYDFAPIGYLTLDELGIIKEANLTAARLLAVERSRLIDRQLNHFMVTEDRGAFRQHLNLVLKGEERQTVEVRLQRKDGNEFFALLESAFYHDITGSSLCRTALTDITKRRQAELALQESEARYRSLFQHNHAVMLLIDPDTGDIVDANPAASAFYGYTHAELISRKITDIIMLPKDRVFEEMQRAASEESRQFFFRHRLAGGEVRDVEVFGGPIHIKSKDLLYSIIHDITDRKQAEEALKQAHGQLEERVKERTADLRHTVEQLQWEIEERQRTEEALKESEQRLRYLTSQLLTAQEEERKRPALELHDDLGQSLMVLKMQLRAIQRKAPPESIEIRESLENPLNFINEVIQRIRRLSHNLRPAILEELGLTAAVQQLFKEFSRQDIEVIMDLDDTEGLFSQEAQLNIYRICQEAFSNITKYAQASQVSVSIKRQDESVVFQVADNGRGFDHHQVVSMHITDRGLGLTAIEERALMLEGSLKIWSQEGRGTKITLIVPIQGK